MTVQPTSVEQVREAVAEYRQLIPVGNRTKPSLACVGGDIVALDMTGVRGITEYEPNEFVFTARAGTPLRDVEETLDEHGQYLPFDPPFVAAGATLGGTVAAGLSGPCRLRYGGVRDFLIGVRFVDGLGKLISAGGKVVKNAAGFDLSKLVIGSRGTLGVLTELTFKVFPRPRRHVTVSVCCPDLDDALRAMSEIARGPWDLEALDLVPPASLFLRLAGHAEPLKARAARLQEALQRPAEIMEGETETEFWAQARDFDWVRSDSSLVKIPLTAGKIAALENCLNSSSMPRRYSVAGHVGWLSWPPDRAIFELDVTLKQLQLQGLAIRGNVAQVQIGEPSSGTFLERVKSVLDPHGRFPE